MLNKDEAERLAAQVLATERGRRPPRRQRIVWCMWLWRVLSPDLRRLPSEAGRDLAYDAVAEANGHWTFKVLSALMPLVVIIVLDRMRLPLGVGLSACLAVPALHTWLAWRGIEHRLPESLAARVEVGEV
ncbi:hypothetical protein [Duganella sp. Root1480D1]|uniref:hypothetical protein n=1 Tax=Duganella sp. Root1480D1 TaxID=1736471 RepID=UPI00070B20A5|nr:hypothetical protein [Duganella sp. Root1480D1]KQZ30352.1 hypothetical protein ASD58_10030 [Duganella sp. Root1480D1]